MSAINDALRRASNAAKSSPTPTEPTSSAVPPPLPPPPVNAAGTPPPPISPPEALPPLIEGKNLDVPPSLLPNDDVPKRSRAMPALFAALVLLCVAGAAASYVYAKKHGRPVLGSLIVSAKEDDDTSANESDVEESAQVNIASAPTNVSNTVTVAAPVAAVTASAPIKPEPAKAPAAAAAPIATATANVMPAVPVRFPSLRLQSIFYRPSNPSVMINGKTLFVSDEIQGVTIADIKPSSVTLVLSGQTNILTLR